MTYPTMRHPKRYVWDFWYYPEEIKTQTKPDEPKWRFHVFYLNADPKLVPEGKHHFDARVGY